MRTGRAVEQHAGYGICDVPVGRAATRTPPKDVTVRTRVPLIMAALSLAVIASCTTTSEGTPVPDSSSEQPTDQPTSGDDLPSDGAPKVENPLDLSHFEENPCDALTAEDAGTLNMPLPGDQTGDSLGETCHWRNNETRGSVFLNFLPGDKRGLSSLYREAKGSDFPYFEPIEEIEGQPAVAYNPDVDEPTIDCTVAVGVTDQLIFSVRVSLSDANVGKKKPCEVASDVAGMMLKTMREAS
jgi:uncharacterized protein DUF3558